jgi:hypothetical protein
MSTELSVIGVPGPEHIFETPAVLKLLDANIVGSALVTTDLVVLKLLDVNIVGSALVTANLKKRFKPWRKQKYNEALNDGIY